MMDIDMDVLKKQSKEVWLLIEQLLLNNALKDEMNSLTKEYVDKLLETAGLYPKDFDMVYEEIWSCVIGFCYGRRAGKDTKGK